MDKATIKKVFWQDIADRVKNVNPNIAKIIDDIDPNNKYPLYLARYPYGSGIVNEGVFVTPTIDGDLVPLEKLNRDQKIKHDLAYAGTGLPTGIVLQNSIHESITTTEQILPLGVVSPGSIFALWKKLDTAVSYHPIKMFNITAGARFIFMLPNISDLSLHKNLKRDFNVRQSPPKTLLDQWNIFKSILSHPSVKCNWYTELLFFSGQWFEKISQDPSWHKLYLYLLEHAWKRSAFERNQMFYGLAFSRAKANRNLKPNPYLSDTIKHLLMIAAGNICGFGVANDESSAPINILQDIYIESYGLRSHIPTIILPKHFSPLQKCSPVYYSLTLPTTLEFSPKSRKISSTLNDLAELSHVTQIFMEEIRKGKLNVEDTVLGNIAREIEFEYYHSKPDKHGEIHLTTKMIKRDPDLITCHKKYGERKFADSGAFIRGCVQLSHK